MPNSGCIAQSGLDQVPSLSATPKPRIIPTTQQQATSSDKTAEALLDAQDGWGEGGRPFSLPSSASSLAMASTVLDAWESCSKTDTLFILVCSVFCWPILPAVGLGYSGYSINRNGLASFYPAVLSIGCCSIQWWFVGYSLAYGEGSGVIGDLKHVFHRGVLADPVGTIPAILFSEFQLIFCATVCAIAVGGACERGRMLPIIPFIFVSTKDLCSRENG